jgi:hypothetical protein
LFALVDFDHFKKSMLEVRKAYEGDATGQEHIQSGIKFGDEGQQFSTLAAEDVNDK